MGVEKRMCRNTTEPEAPRPPAIPNEAKVYSLQYPVGEEMERIVAAVAKRQVMVARVRVLALYVALAGILVAVNGYSGKMLAGAAVGLAVGWTMLEILCHRGVKRQVKRQVPVIAGNKTTLTIADGGLVLENGRGAVCCAWHLLSKPQMDRKLGILNIATTVRLLGFPLHGLDEAQREKVFREIQARAGKRGGTVPPPPADASRAHPVTLTHDQRREAYDIMAMRIHKPWLALVFLLLMPVPCWCLCEDLWHFVWSGGEQERGQLFLFILLVYLVYTLAASLLHPGRKLMRAFSSGKALQMRTTAYLFDTEGRRVLALAGENGWTTWNFELIEAVARGKSCLMLLMRGADGGIGLPLDAELPPGLPAEVPARRRSRLAIPAIILSILACIAALALSNFASLRAAADKTYSPSAEAIYDEVAAPILYPEFWRPATGR